MSIIDHDYDDIVVDGKPMKEWYQSDNGIVDYEKPLGFGNDVSADPNYRMLDMGLFVIDTEVAYTPYSKGIDMTRFTGCAYRGEAYDEAWGTTVYDGEDCLGILNNHLKNITLRDIVKQYFGGFCEDVYVSKETKHIMLKVRKRYSVEEKVALMKEQASRLRSGSEEELARIDQMYEEYLKEKAKKEE